MTAPAPAAERRRATGAAARLLRNPFAVVPTAVLLVVVLATVFAPLLTSQDPAYADIAGTLRPAGGDHLLGTDNAGRDVYSRLLYAGRASLLGAALALVTGMVLGVVGGLWAGYYGRRAAMFLNWGVELVMALPGIVVLLAVRAVTGPSMTWSMFVLGVLAAPAFYRVVAGSVASVRTELFVDAARVSGLTGTRILWRHVLPLVRGQVLIQAAMVAAVAISIQAGLDFLGLGDPSTATWGNVLSSAFATIGQLPTQVLWPSLVIGLVCVSLALLANALRDELGLGGARTEAEPAAVEAGGTEAPPVSGDPSGPDALLTVRGLKVGYRQESGRMHEVVHGVDLTVRRGEVHGLVGESGAGKTQTAFALMGLLGGHGSVTAGSVLLEDRELARLPEREMAALRGTRIGYVPQEPGVNLSPTATVGSQLCEPLRLRLGLSRAQAREKVLGLLARVGLPDPQRVFDSYPHQISGGMAQRVLIAGAVACDPDLLIADEPTTALDVTVQAEVLDLLRSLREEREMTVVLVTHNLGVVADLCDRVSVMRHGRVVETGPVREVFDAPRAAYTRDLLDCVLDDAEAREPLAAATGHAAAAVVVKDGAA
ncbi:dipeptide/oligopeptide/nickel ABC transporter permease/ATP-binding protein [Streptomyces sp. NPDC002746]